MIGYVTLGTKDLERAARFYDGLLAELGGSRVMEFEDFIGWATGPGQPMVSVVRPWDRNPPTVGNGVMVALSARSPEHVDAIYRKAMALGATDEGAPGPRGEGFYAAYFRDLDGNKLNAHFMG